MDIALKKPRGPVWLKCIVLMSVAGLAVLFWMLRDEAPPPIADLKPRARTLPDSENALLVLRTIAIERAAFTKDETYQAAVETLEEHPDDLSAARQIVEIRADLWPRFDAALRLPNAEAPIPQSLDKVIPTGFAESRELWAAALARARLIAREESADAGLGQTLRLIENARVQTDAGGTLIDYLSTAAARLSALRNLQAIVQETTPSDSALRDSLRRLERARPDSAALAETFRAEHAFSIIALTEMDKVLANAQTSAGPDSRPPVGVRWFFKPNKTIRLTSERIRSAIALIDEPLDLLNAHYDHETAVFPAALIGRVPHPDNALGRYALNITADTYRTILKIRLRDQTTLSVTQAWLAVLLHQREHGKLPADLNALVPAYLASLPRDYLGGAPVRYSSEFGAIWSVGENNLVVQSPDQVIPDRDLCLFVKPHPKPPAPGSDSHR